MIHTERMVDLRISHAADGYDVDVAESIDLVYPGDLRPDER